MNPIAEAVKNNDLKKLNQLIKSGEPINNRDGSISNTALIWSVSLPGKVEYKITECLIENGAKVNEQNMFGDTALIMAVKNSNLHAVKALITAKADTSIKNNLGQTALDEANRMAKQLTGYRAGFAALQIVSMLEQPEKTKLSSSFPTPKIDIATKRPIRCKGPVRFK